MFLFLKTYQLFIKTIFICSFSILFHSNKPFICLMLLKNLITPMINIFSNYFMIIESSDVKRFTWMF